MCSGGVSFPVTLTVPDFPFDAAKGSHPVLLEKEIFIGMYVCMYVCTYIIVYLAIYETSTYTYIYSIGFEESCAHTHKDT